MSIIIDRDIFKYTLPCDMTLADATSRFLREILQMIIVVDAEERFAGLLTQGDIVRALHNQNSTKIKLGDICNENAKTATLASLHRDTASLRADYEAFGMPVLQMPVLDEAKRVIGVASLGEDECQAEAINKISSRGITPIPYLKKIWELAKYADTKGVSGDFVECGTWRGSAIATAAAAHLNQGRPARHIHVLDSFDGTSLRKNDGRTNFSKYPNVNYHPVKEIFDACVGYPDEMLHFSQIRMCEKPNPDLLPERIALLNLDGDWHYTLSGYLPLGLQRMADGGIVAIDDYSHIAGFIPFIRDAMQTEGYAKLLNRADGALYFTVDRQDGQRR